MKRASILLALTLFGALPLAAQTHEFGVMLGGSRRFIENGPKENPNTWIDSNFSFDHSVVDLYWAIPLDEDTYVKIKAGRIDSAIAFEFQRSPEFNDKTIYRRDAEGEIQHLEVNAEYRFSEPYGKTGLFAGIGVYRQSSDTLFVDIVAPGGTPGSLPPRELNTQSFGFNAGVNADFPVTRRFGVVVEATYHWTRGDFRPKYLTATGGLRIAF